MHIYTFKEPFFLTSKHKTPIHQIDKGKVGYIQKCYDNKVKRYISLLLNKLYFHYDFYTATGTRISSLKNIKENKKDYMRSRWLFKKDHSNVIIRNKTKFKTNIRFEIDIGEDSPIEVTREFADNKVVFRRSNEQLAVIHHNKTIPRKVTIHIYNEEVISLDLSVFIYFVYRIYSL